MSIVGSFVRGTMLRVTGTSLRAELAQVTRQLDKLRHRLEKSEQKNRDLRKRLVAHRRRARAAQLDAAILEQVLPLRYATIVASNHDGRAEREAAFIARSASYRVSLSAASDAASGFPDPVMIDGLSWHVPHGRHDDGGIAKRIAHRQRLPLQEILDARELAVGRIMIDIGANIGTTSIPRVVLGDFA